MKSTANLWNQWKYYGVKCLYIMYICVVKYSNYWITSVFCCAVPPSVEATTDSITAVQGDTLTLSCVATGIPTPTIDWYVTQL